MCNSEHEEAKRSRQKCKKFFQEQAEVNKPSRYAEDAPNARSWGGNALSDRRRSLCAASRAKKGAHVRSGGQFRELLAV